MTRLFALAVIAGGLACADYQVVLVPDSGADSGVDASSPDSGSDSGLEMPDAGGDGGLVEPPFPYGACADLGRRVTLSPLDLMVLLDVSGSMDYDLKWVAVKSAMSSFVTEPAFTGLGVGIEYFPNRVSCTSAEYETPEIPIGLLPSNSNAILQSLSLQRMSGGTPTATAMQGAVEYLQAHLATPQAMGRKGIIVLATDGVPDGTCGGVGSASLANTIPSVVSVAAAAAAQSPPIQTFVIGVGTELGSLDQVADAGQTGKAVLVDVAGNTDVQFLAALTQIRRQALGCSFELTDPLLDATFGVRVSFKPDTGGPTLKAFQVSDATACVDGAQRWYFSDATARTVVLCPTTCDAITSGTTGLLKVEVACGVN